MSSSMSYYAQCLKSYVEGLGYDRLVKFDGPYSEDLHDYNHMYIMYAVGERVFTVHYTLEYGTASNGVYPLTVKEIETLKYNDKSDRFFDTVSRVNMNKGNKQYTPFTNVYELDITVDIGQYKVSAYNYWYNYNNSSTSQPASNIYQVVMASD